MTEDVWIAEGSVLAVLAEKRGARACLEAAASACGALDNAAVVALHVRVDPMTDILPTDEILLPDQQRVMEVAAAVEGHALHDVYASWIVGLSSHMEATWREVTGGEVAKVKELGEKARLTVIVKPGKESGDHARQAFRSCLFSTGKPCLVVPEDYQGADPCRILIAWKDTSPSRRVLDAAAPWLKRAEKVLLLQVGEQRPGELAWAQQRLIDLEVACEMRNIAYDESRSVGQQALDEAKAFGADWLVAGAYHHGQIVEWILGGVTEALLEKATIPLFLMH